ncbi:hypothetical protein BGW38_010966 [Lunasporangiospora selenospora]|uniref:Uncharacterized protein n=1 Tax=Lunasporangiospora selenospora TaxID=979761 RepID=A0A9P6FVH2_9FUNG|nr:hypothetical protein BGW38_010966 [Lunasporangiospora selenospora]
MPGSIDNGQSTDAASLIPPSLISNSIFHRGRRAPELGTSGGASSKGTPISIPQTTLTELFPKDFSIKQEPTEHPLQQRNEDKHRQDRQLDSRPQHGTTSSIDDSLRRRNSLAGTSNQDKELSQSLILRSNQDKNDDTAARGERKDVAQDKHSDDRIEDNSSRGTMPYGQRDHGFVPPAPTDDRHHPMYYQGPVPMHYARYPPSPWHSHPSLPPQAMGLPSADPHFWPNRNAEFISRDYPGGHPGGYQGQRRRSEDRFLQDQSRHGRQFYDYDYYQDSRSHKLLSGPHINSDRGAKDPSSSEKVPFQQHQHPEGGRTQKRRSESHSPERRKRPAAHNGHEGTSSTVESIQKNSLPQDETSQVTDPLKGISPATSSESDSSDKEVDWRVKMRGGSDNLSKQQQQQKEHEQDQVQLQLAKAAKSAAIDAGEPLDVGKLSSGPEPNQMTSSSSSHRKKRQKEISSSSKYRRNKRKKEMKDSSSSDSTSDSSTSSDGDEDSSDSGHDEQPFSGTSRLKHHGIIHDLMLEVKASSKRIRDLSRKLERQFRNLDEIVGREAASTGLGRSLVVAPTARSSQNEKAVANNIGSNSNNSSSVNMNSKGSSSSSSKASSSSTQVQNVTSPTSVSMTSATAMAKQPVKRSKTKQQGQIPIASSGTLETLSVIHKDVRSKFFSRKAKTMVLHSPIAGPDMEDLMVTTAFDGSINLWDLDSKKTLTTIPKSSLNMPWAEDVCWVGKNTLAVATATKDGVPLSRQLSLLHVSPPKQGRSLSSGGLQWRLQQLEEVPHDSLKGGILCMTGMSEDMSGVSMATAGRDKQIIQWKFSNDNTNGDYTPVRQRAIHSKHTSTIQSIYYAPHSQTLYSGGMDCKVLGWNMERSDIVLEHKSVDQGRITHLAPNPQDMNLMLICHATTSNQLTLHDMRTRFETPVLKFGFHCADNLSKCIMPSWHPDGALVSCGMQVESKINIWDIRWKNTQRGAGQSIDIHDKRVFRAAFHPRRSLMASMSSDSSLAFV